MHDGCDDIYMSEVDNTEKDIEDDSGEDQLDEIPVPDIIAETGAECPGGCTVLVITFASLF